MLCAFAVPPFSDFFFFLFCVVLIYRGNQLSGKQIAKSKLFREVMAQLILLRARTVASRTWGLLGVKC